MPVLSCPACAKKLKVADGSETKRFKCPGCGGIVSGTASSMPVLSPETPATAKHMKPVATPAPIRGKVDPSPPKPESNILLDAAPPPPVDTARLTSFLRPAKEPDELGRLGGYRILRILGHGGMGVVFYAEDVKLKRPVALKVMLPEMSVDATSTRRFLREAEAVAKVSHANVVRIYQVDEDAGIPFMAMEYLTGESLESRLEREPILPTADALRIVREVAAALEAAHARSLVHRDVKPSNVWLDDQGGGVKLLDFGLVRPQDDASNLTKSGLVLGTPEYMAPEQARGQKVDARSDIFCLGILLYRLCCGEVPFKGSNAVALLVAMTKETPKSPQLLNFEVSPETEELIFKMLAKDPANRVQTATEVIAAIKAIEAGETTPRETATKPIEKKKARPMWPFLVGGGVAAVAAVGTYFALR